MRKKFFVFISVSIMALMLAACGATDNSSSPSGDVTNKKNEVSSSASTNADTNVEANTNTTPEPEQVAVEPGIEQSVGEYITTQDKAPKYYLINPIYQCLDELGVYNIQQLLENRVAIVYFGEERIPSPNDKVLIVPTFFDETVDQKTLEEVIETINGYYIKEIINTPLHLEVVSNQYSDPKPPKATTPFIIGERLEYCIDIDNYTSYIFNQNVKSDSELNISGVLPFMIYNVDPSKGLCAATKEDEPSILNPGPIFGKVNSIMVVKMNDMETYDLLSRAPLFKEDSKLACDATDLGGFIVTATNLTKEEVERVVLPGGTINPDYAHLFKNIHTSRVTSPGQVLWEHLLTHNKNVRYFIVNPYEEIYEELSMGNKMFLIESPTVYVYLENYRTLKKEVVTIETCFDEDVRNMSLEEVINIIRCGEIVSVENEKVNDLLNE